MKNELKRVLCFGDSNTYGAIPHNDDRFPAHIRWTGILQTLLRDKIEVIEEGLCGRTVATKHPALATQADGLEYFYHGGQYFYPCIMSHDPIDLVVIMLGTNDIKNKYGKTIEEITNDLEKFFINAVIREENLIRKPEILLVAPIPMNETYEYVKANFIDGNAKLEKLSREYEALTERHKIHFMNAFDLRYVGDDGLHFNAEGHALFAQNIASKISTLLALHDAC